MFEGLVGWGKNSMGWRFGFKLHLIISDRGELLTFKLTPGNVDDRIPVPDLAQDLFGKRFGDQGYISQPLFENPPFCNRHRTDVIGISGFLLLVTYLTPPLDLGDGPWEVTCQAIF